MKEKSLKRILILGSAVIDVIVTIDRLPLAGEDIPGLQKGMLVGGCAFNVSKILDGLQIPHDLCVPVGQGMYADRIREALHEGGHEILIEDDREDNGYCLSLVEKNGERTFISIDGIETNGRTHGWNASMPPTMTTSMLPAMAFRTATPAERSSCASLAARKPMQNSSSTQAQGS